MTVEAYLETTRTMNAAVDQRIQRSYRAMYDNILALAPIRIAPVDAPELLVVNSLNKLSSIFSFDDRTTIVHDQYLGQTLSELTALFFGAPTPRTSTPMAWRLFSEYYSTMGLEKLATVTATQYSILRNEAPEYRGRREFGEANERFLSTQIQETFIIAHELAHFFWSKPEYEDFLKKASSDLSASILEDAAVRADPDAVVKAYLDDLSFQYHGKAVLHEENLVTAEDHQRSKQLIADLRKQFDQDDIEDQETARKWSTDPVVLEELWADWFASMCCLTIFLAQPLPQVFRAIHLAMENVTTLGLSAGRAASFIGDAVPHTSIEEVAMRKRLVRRFLSELTELLQLREQGKRRGMIRTFLVRMATWRQQKVTQKNVAQSVHEIMVEANVRYHRFVSDPIVIEMPEIALPKEDDLHPIQFNLQGGPYPNVAQGIIRSRAITRKSLGDFRLTK